MEDVENVPPPPPASWNPAATESNKKRHVAPAASKSRGRASSTGTAPSVSRRPLIGVRQKLTLVRPAAASASAAAHPNPFGAARNLYYDERWVQKQEAGFLKWLNFILTPDCGDDDGATAVPGKIDVAKLWKACTAKARVPRAPTKEALSLRAYSARRELNRLRRNACTLWQTPGIARVVSKVEAEIEANRLLVRKDRCLNKDVGMKQGFLELLLSYNTLWLKIGLETIYGEVLNFAGGVDNVVGISHFIVTRMLSNPDILAKHAHPTVPHLYTPGCDEAIKQFTLKKFLQLVYFLDNAKKHRIIKHNPCLFQKDSPIKQSRDVVAAFSRDYLSGEGDVIKHLGYLDFRLEHKQTALDEFDYAVSNLAVDLRDGVRLTRVVEFLCPQSARLSDRLRVPAISRLQKVHNVDLALAGLRSSAVGLPESISAKHIVDGHMEKTLMLMWHIIFGFQLDHILDEEKLRREVEHLKKSLRYRVLVRDPEATRGHKFVLECLQQEEKEASASSSKLHADDAWLKTPKMRLLLWWARLVAAHYNVRVCEIPYKERSVYLL